MKHGLDFSYKQKELDTALLTAVKNCNVELINSALDQGANADAIDDDDDTSALFWAITAKNKEIISLLLSKGANIKTKDKFDHTFLHMAAFYNRIDLIKLALDNGIDINIKDKFGETPLNFAITVRNIDLDPEVVEFLAKNGADINTKDDQGTTPLHLAAQKNLLFIAKLLIEHGAEVNIKSDHKKATPLHIAAQNNAESIIEILVKNKASLEAEEGNYRTPLHIAVIHNKIDAVKKLIQLGADVNAIDKGLLSPLHYAAVYGFNNMVKLLLDHGANIRTKASDNTTAIDLAKSNNHMEVVNTLKIALDLENTDNNRTIEQRDIEEKKGKEPEEIKEIKSPTLTKASAVNDSFLISYEGWVVSIMRKAEVGNKEHAFLMVEGINQFGKSVVRRYDLVMNDDRKNYSQILILPPDDMQAEVKTVANWTKGDKCYYQSWAITRDQAAQLHDNVLRDKKIANSEEGIRYFVSGDQSLIGKSSLKQGHSCFTWAREKLIEIEDERKIFTKNLKPKITDCIVAQTSLYLPKPKEGKKGFGFKFK